VSRIPNLASERGAVLIQTAVAALVLVGFGTFVVDYGVLWVARHQAQNAADAGAMAGALARAYEDFDEAFDPDSVAAQNASQVAGTNAVWGASSPPIVSFDCPPELVPSKVHCVRVDVYRNGAPGTGSASLPTFFAPILGSIPPHYGVKATATAQVMISNGTNCLRPWAIPDKWIGSPGGPFTPPADTYAPPSPTGPGTGLTFPTSNSDPADLGQSLQPLRFDDLTDPTNKIFRNSVVRLEPPSGYFASITTCNREVISVGDQIAFSAATPSNGDFSGLHDLDPGAAWNNGNNTIDGSCAPACAPLSPRLVAVAVFDVGILEYRRSMMDWSACPPGRTCTPCPGPCVSIVNIVGFFIGNPAGSKGYLTSYPGLIPNDAPQLAIESSFLKAITLVR
jgi:hypothetical protein